MEKWQEDAGTGHTHEPHEVTVQLDGLGRHLRAMQAREAVAEPSSDGPVFVDASGRRSKKFRRLGWVLAVGCACYAITVLAALLGGDSSAPFLPGLGEAGKPRTDQVEIQPAPTEHVSGGVATPEATPGVPVPDDSAVAVLPQPSSGQAGGASLPPAEPEASGGLAPDPSRGTTTPGPQNSAPASDAGEPDPGISEPAPELSDPAPTGSPSEPPAQEGAL